MSQKLVPRTLQVLKRSPTPFSPKGPHQTKGNHIPNIQQIFSRPTLPTKQNIFHTPWQYPGDAKRRQYKTPQLISHLAMNQKVIHPLPTILTHTKANHYSIFSLPKIVTRIFPHTAVQIRKDTLQGAPFTPQKGASSISFLQIGLRKYIKACHTTSTTRVR